jgi:hypothetical protein
MNEWLVEWTRDDIVFPDYIEQDFHPGFAGARADMK